MTTTKYEVDKFIGANNFSLWRIEMTTLLVHQGIVKAINAEALPTVEDAKKKLEIETKAHSVILLSLGDEVLREVADEEKALGLWDKLATICRKKSLANKLYLKKKLYSLRMEEGKELRKYIDDFNKVVLDFNNISAKVDEEDRGYNPTKFSAKII
uniref:Retrovirus-related Pol polyprotein from transposon TNT 1-94 n=1 Tax=Cannabis sativa TaxID=3483 RepID=A0A803NJZ9_CANSA